MKARDGMSRALQWLALGAIVAGAVALGFLALTRDTAADDEVAEDPTTSASTEGSPSPSPTETEGASPEDLPKIKDQRRADFTTGDDLPDGADLVDLVEGQTGLELTEAGLVHGEPSKDGGGAGFLEAELKSEVHKLGARITFAREAPGTVVLAAWETSVTESESASLLPRTGMRLVITPGHWELVVRTDIDEVVAKGDYNSLTGETVEFELLRQGDLAFVIDPSGRITEVVYPQASRLAGPWASWGLVESAGQLPATIESVWAG